MTVSVNSPKNNKYSEIDKIDVFNCFECIIIRYLNIDLNGDQIYRKHLCIDNFMIYLQPVRLNFESIHIFRNKSVSGARQIDFIYKISNE